MQIVTGRRGEPHVTSRQMQAVYRSFLGDFALLDIGEKLRAEAYSNDIVRVYDGVVSVQGIYAVIAYNQYDEVYIEPVSVGKKRIDTIVLHYTKDNALDVEDLQLDVVQGEEYTDNPIAPVVHEGGDAWEGTTDIQVPIYDVEVTNFGLTVIPHARMLTVIPTLDSIAERIPETFVTGVKGDSEVLYRDGNVNITKANIGLGNVDNTADTDKPISTATQTALNFKADLTYVDAKIAAAYHAGGSKTVAELTSALLIADNMGKVYNMSDSGVTTSEFVEGAGEPINEGDNVGICNVGTEESPVYKFDLLSGFVDLSAYVTTTAMNTALTDKVDKVEGKGLSTNDYTTADKNKLAGIEAEANKTVVDSAMSDSSTNPLQNKVITKELEGTKTTSGNPLTVSDAAPVNAVNLSMDLEPIQDLHGYDHPWVGGAGKNKLPVTSSDETVGGVTYTKLLDNDSNVIGIKCVGTISGTSAKYLSTNGTLPAGTYVLTGGSGVSSAGIRLVASYTESGTNKYIEVTSEQGVTFSLNTETQVAFYLRGEQANLAVDTVIYPMIRLSTETDSSFAPYTNICPISGRTKENVNVSRPNLYVDGTIEFKQATAWMTDNTETAQSITGISASGNVINGTPSTSYFWMHIPFSFRKNRTVYLKFDGTHAVPSMFRISNGNGQYITYIDTKDQYTPSEDFDGFIDLGYDSALFTNYKIGIGYTSTFDIDAYNEKPPKTYTIQLGDTIYGGELDVLTGKLRVDRAMRLVSGYTWYGSNGAFYTDSVINSIKHGDGRFDHVISSVYETQNIGSTTPLSDGGISVDASGYVQLKDLRYSTASDFKANMGTTQLVYELAEPYTIKLTPQQIKMLENTNTIYTDYEGDTITIEYQPNNAIGEAVRAVEKSYDPEFAIRPVLKKKSFSGTTDSDGAVTLINASDIPSGHKIIPLHITDMTINGSVGTYFVEYDPYNSGDLVKGYCYTFFNGSRITPVGSAVTGNFYYYELEV